MHATHNAQSKRCRAQKNRATEHSKVKYNICVWYILNTAKYNTHIHVAKHPTTSTICTSKLEKTKLGQCGKSCYARRRIAAMHIAYTRRRGSNSERECTIIELMVAGGKTQSGYFSEEEEEEVTEKRGVIMHWISEKALWCVSHWPHHHHPDGNIALCRFYLELKMYVQIYST